MKINSFNSVFKDIFIVVLDIIAVNLSYFIALYIRYYVNAEYNPNAVATYIKFCRFAPIYTVLCILVFWLFRLYGGMWRYAGLNDMNRVLAANALLCVVYVAATTALYGRMPLAYYIIGASIQFGLIALIRFSYRFAVLEGKKIRTRREGTEPAMVVGSGGAGRRFVRRLEGDAEAAWRPVVYVGAGAGQLLNGIPVIGYDDVDSTVDNMGIKAIFIADPMTKPEVRDGLKRLAEEKGIEFIDYSGYLANMSGRIPLASLLEVMEGEVRLSFKGEEKVYAQASDAAMDLKRRYYVSGIEGNQIKILLSEDDSSHNWMKEYKDETGEDVSFF